MKDTLKDRLFSIIQASLIVALVAAVLISPARTDIVIPEAKADDTFVVVDEDVYLYGQDQVQAELHLKLENNF